MSRVKPYVAEFDPIELIKMHQRGCNCENLNENLKMEKIRTYDCFRNVY